MGLEFLIICSLFHLFLAVCFVHKNTINTFSSRLLMGGGPIRADSLPYLIDAIRSRSKDTDAIISIINTICSNNKLYMESNMNYISGRWKLIWTSNRESLYSSPTHLYQSIDLIARTIQTDLIRTSNLNLALTGTIVKDNTQYKTRLYYAYDNIQLVTKLFSLTLPVLSSEGRSDNLYVNGRYRISRDKSGRLYVYELSTYQTSI